MILVAMDGTKEGQARLLSMSPCDLIHFITSPSSLSCRPLPLVSASSSSFRHNTLGLQIHILLIFYGAKQANAVPLLPAHLSGAILSPSRTSRRRRAWGFQGHRLNVNYCRCCHAQKLSQSWEGSDSKARTQRS